MSRVPGSLLRALVLVVAWALPAGAAPAPEPGLMWHHSGLPAVFPLIVKSGAGTDHVMTLHRPDTGDAVLAAYVRGGVFFRVLVPPGTFEVRFASGQRWQGEEALFGPLTRRWRLPEPLTFEVRGLGVKSGHVIDMRTLAEPPVIEARADCQRLTVVRFPRPLPPPEDSGGFATRLTTDGRLPRHPEAGFDPERLAGAEVSAPAMRRAPYFSDPEVVVVTVPCP